MLKKAIKSISLSLVLVFAMSISNPALAKPQPTISIEPIVASAYLNQKYILPETVLATMSDSSMQEVAVTWTPLPVKTKAFGVYTYTGKVNGYSGIAKLTLTVLNISIVSIDPLNVEVNHHGIYSLPNTVSAKMSDNSTWQVDITWNPKTADTSTVGIRTYTGTVGGYSKAVVLNLTVVPIIESIEDSYIVVLHNDSYSLPESLPATMSDGTTRDVEVTWDEPASTDMVGSFTYTGTVNE